MSVSPGLCVVCQASVPTVRNEARYCSSKCRQLAYRRRSARRASAAPVPTSAPGNLTTGVDSFIGRVTELATLTSLLKQHRLVTVVGPAGVGKTRLALEVAAQVRNDHHDGAWFVDLAEIRREDLVEAAIARTLGVQLGAQSLVEALAAKDCLLLLDNCEHVINSTAATVTAVLRGCPRVKVLATSRECLRSAGEQLFGLQAVDAESAVRLFVERARCGRPRLRAQRRGGGAVRATGVDYRSPSNWPRDGFRCWN